MQSAIGSPSLTYVEVLFADSLSDLAQVHPSFSPDGAMTVTDVYGGDYANMIVLIDPETGIVD